MKYIYIYLFLLLFFFLLAGTSQNSVDSLSFEALIPKSIVQRYISLLLEHRRIILCGPSGTGKTYLAQKLAEYLVLRWANNLPVISILFFTFIETFYPFGIWSFILSLVSAPVTLIVSTSYLCYNINHFVHQIPKSFLWFFIHAVSRFN